MVDFQKALTSLINLLALSGGRDKVNIYKFSAAELFNTFVSFLQQDIKNNMTL